MKKIITLIFVMLSLPLQAGTTTISGVRLWGAPDHTRLVFDATGPIEHSIFRLTGPERLVVDIKDARLGDRLPKVGDNLHLQGVRSAVREGKDLRVVLDLKQAVRPKSFLLSPNQTYGHRLVIDLYGEESAAKSKPRVVASAPRSSGPRDIVVAIDAGHGGEDVGAIGARGTREKDVVFAVAHTLEALVEAEPGMRAVMIRAGDYFVPLRKRMEIARRNRADIFISVHADAFRDPRVRGASVYTLSNRGASSEAARWLAESENASDLVGGVSLDDKDNILASVLLDLSQTATRQVSTEAADRVYQELKKVGKVHGRRVQQAGFVVLKSPDIPSLLVETAYISNPSEERKLKDPGHQKKLARAILSGVRSYFREAPPPGTRLAARATSRQHVISRGETLSGIAEQYRISLASLRDANRLAGDRIRVGQVLEIPGG